MIANRNIPFASFMRYASMRYVPVFIFALFVISCGSDSPPPKPKPQMNMNDVKNDLEFANKVDRKRELDEISQVIARHNWTMSVTKSGIHYMHIKEGEGAAVKMDQIAKVNYKITLLDGTFCYSSDSTGAKEVRVGHDAVEAGLHEALQLMHVGDKMRFILPSYLAHGLLGDGDKIPALSSVIYEVELLSVR